MNGFVLLEIYVFVLACFAGYQLIAKVPPTLHTPLMSGSNAISGITILGAMQVSVVAEGTPFGVSTIVGMIAVALASLNVVGGFLVTDRMLRMFKPEAPTDATKDAAPTAGAPTAPPAAKGRA